MLRPKKFLGQHFLQSRRVLEKIIRAAELTGGDIVLEIGPGTGILTEELAKKAKKVVSVEKDRELCAFLTRKFSYPFDKAQGKQKNVEIVQGDILRFNPTHYALSTTHYKIVANIPYYLTGRLLRQIFEGWPRPSLMVLMLQKEVAKRIVAQPPKMNLLALSVQYFSNPVVVGLVPKESFRPKPKVDSAIVKFLPKRKINTLLEKRFFALAHLGFQHPRKLLIKNLSSKYTKNELQRLFFHLHIAFLARASEVSLATWLKMAKLLSQ